MIIWITELIRIWTGGKYLYKDASGAMSYSLALYLIFGFVALSHYLANQDNVWFSRLKKVCRDIVLCLGAFVFGISGILGLAHAQFIQKEIPSWDLDNLIGSVMAHGLFIVIPLVAHYISQANFQTPHK